MPEYKLSSKFNDSFSLYSKENVQNHFSQDFSTLSKVEPGGSAAKKFRSWASSMHDLSGDFKVLKKESEENQKDDVTKDSILQKRASFLKDYIFKTLLDPIDLKERVNFDKGVNDSASEEKWNQFGNGSKELSEYRKLLCEKSEEERKYIKQHCKNVDKVKGKSKSYDYDEDRNYAYKNANKLVETIGKRYGDQVDEKNSSLLNMSDYITPNFIKGLADICKNEKIDKDKIEDSSTEYSKNVSEISEFSDGDSMEDFDEISKDSLDDDKSNKKMKNKNKNKKIKTKEKEIKYPNLYNFLYLNGNNLIKWSKEQGNISSEDSDDDSSYELDDEYDSDSDDKSKKLKKIALGYLLDAAISDLRKYENEYTYKLQEREKNKKGFLKRSWEEIKRPFSKLKQAVVGERKNKDLIFDEEYENDKFDDNSSFSENDDNSTKVDSKNESLEDIENEKSEKLNKNTDLKKMNEIAFLSTLIANAHKQLNGIKIESISEKEEEEDKNENEEKNVINIDDHGYDPYRYIEKLSSEKKIAESEKLKKYYDNRAELLAYYDSLSNMDLNVMINEKNDNDNNINYDEKILKEEMKINNVLNGEKTKKTQLEEDFKSLGSQIKMAGTGKDKIVELRKKIVEKNNEYNKCNKNIEKYEKNLKEISEHKAKTKNEYKSKNYESELKNISAHVHIILDKIYAAFRNPELEIRNKVDSAKKYAEAIKQRDDTWTNDNTDEYIASEVLSCNLDSYSTHYSNIISQIKENKIKTKFWNDDIDFKKISFSYSGKDNTINNPNSLEPKRDNEHIAISDFDKIKNKFPKSVKNLNTDILLNRFYHPYSDLCNTILNNHSFGDNGLNEIIESEKEIFDGYIKNKINLTEMEIHTLNQLINLDKNNPDNKKRKEEIKNKENKIKKLSKGEYEGLSENEHEEISRMTHNSNEMLKNYVTSNFDMQISKLDKTNEDFGKISTEVEGLLKEFSEFKSFYGEDQKKDLDNFTKDYDSKKKLYDKKIKNVSDKKNEIKQKLKSSKQQYDKSINDAENNAKNNGGLYKKEAVEYLKGMIQLKSLKLTTDLKTKIIDKSKEYDKIISNEIKGYEEYIKNIINDLNAQKNELSGAIQKYKKTFSDSISKKLESFKKNDDEKRKKEKEDVNRKINEEFEKNREYMKRLNSGESIQDIWKDKEGKNKKIEKDDSQKIREFLMKLANSIKDQPEQSAE